MPIQGRIPIRDASGETGTANINLNEFLGSAGALAELNAIYNGAVTDGMILGLSNGPTVSYSAPAVAGPVGAGAEREFKWLVGIQDTQEFLDPPTNSVANPAFGKNYTFSLPTADASIKPVGSDNLPLADVPTFVAAVEAAAKSPTGGAVAVTYIKIVGRNI